VRQRLRQPTLAYPRGAGEQDCLMLRHPLRLLQQRAELRSIQLACVPVVDCLSLGRVKPSPSGDGFSTRAAG
jgi:hypothetical protein